MERRGCVFDSINHVRRFSDWKKVFSRVHEHLLPGGCFLFDINTERKLERHIVEQPGYMDGRYK